MNLRKTFFILPNLFTLSSVFCGFFAITQCAGAPSMEALYQAAIAICFAYFFDLTDGRVARLTKTQSSLGLQLDSLADVISFGVAPALLVYKWGLTRFGIWGVFIAFLFCGAAALRLARFNVLAMQHDSAQPGKYILGLPVPASSAVLVSIVVLNYQLGGSFVQYGQVSLALLVSVLSYLMVSRIRFRSFKDLKIWSRRSVFVILLILAFTVMVQITQLHFALIFVVLMGAYLALGLMDEVIFYRRRKEDELAAKAEKPLSLSAAGGAQSDEEVLAELGAFDDEERTQSERAAPLTPRRSP